MAEREREPRVVGAEQLAHRGVVRDERGDDAKPAARLLDREAALELGDAEQQERDREAEEERDERRVAAERGDAGKWVLAIWGCARVWGAGWAGRSAGATGIDAGPGGRPPSHDGV